VLGISTATAQKHVTNLLRRLGAPNRAAAVAMVSGHLIGSERRAG
jgi:DNA-binding CsgD family transcriptional regulator